MRILWDAIMDVRTAALDLVILGVQVLVQEVVKVVVVEHVQSAAKTHARVAAKEDAHTDVQA